MPSTKDKVVSYLEDDESQVFSNFCKEKGCSSSQGVASLIREHLLEDKEHKIHHLYNERLTRSERTLDEWVDIFFRCNEAIDKLSRLVAMTQSDVDAVREQLQKQEQEQLDDEIISAITGQPVEKVYLWRLGYLKPRGRRIKENLSPYLVKEGRWVRK